jgi:xanthosine utilization system XapX-like protein
VTGAIRKLTSPAPVAAPSSSSPLWENTRTLIETGAVTPILSNGVISTLFAAPLGEIACAWAADVGSPLPETENCDLARVAQFHAVHLKDPVEAKRHYLEAIKGYLVARAQDDPNVDNEIVNEFLDPGKRRQMTFSGLARQLGYPRYPDPLQNPLRLLAELPLPIYLTTSPHTFLEWELARTGSRTPETAIFYWHDGLRSIPSVFEREPDYTPSRARPLVYHLFGLDDHARSLVLTEDDYLDYLVKLSTLNYEVKHADKQLDIPAPVTLALTGTALLLLGYQVVDWDFRVLFKGLVQATRESRQGRTEHSVAVQLAPETEAARRDEICKYLEQFFEPDHFSVYWGDLAECLGQVYRLWKGG